MTMNSDEDFYLVHLGKEIDLINCAKNNNKISIIREDICKLTQDFVSKTYHVEYNNIALFRFNLTTTREPINNVIVKHKIIIQEINTNESITNFVKRCEIYAEKIFNDYQLISKKFYINEFSCFYDKLYIKNVSGNPEMNHVEIEITIDGFYLLIISNVIIYNYLNVDDLIESMYISPLRRTLFKNMLNFFGLL